jgi:hypothetical protein
VGGQSA